MSTTKSPPDTPNREFSPREASEFPMATDMLCCERLSPLDLLAQEMELLVQESSGDDATTVLRREDEKREQAIDFIMQRDQECQQQIKRKYTPRKKNLPAPITIPSPKKHPMEDDGRELVSVKKPKKTGRPPKETPPPTLSENTPKCAKCKLFLYDPYISSCSKCCSSLCGPCAASLKQLVECQLCDSKEVSRVIPNKDFGATLKEFYPKEWHQRDTPSTIPEWVLKYSTIDPTLKFSTNANYARERKSVLRLLQAISKDIMVEGRLVWHSNERRNEIFARDGREIRRYTIGGCGDLQFSEKPNEGIMSGCMVEVEIYNESACIRCVVSPACPCVNGTCQLHQ